MELLSIPSPRLSANPLSSHPSLGFLKIRNPLSKSPAFSLLRPFTPSPSFKCSLSSHQLSKNPKTLAGSSAPPPLGLEVEEEPRHPLHMSAPQTPQTAMRGAETDAMGLLLRERIVFLGNQIDDFLADAVISQLLLLDAQDPTKDIRLFINSPGGSLSATMAIYDIVKLVRADVSTVALGISASTASIVLGAGTKGKRLAMPNTRIMIHQPLGGASGQVIDVEVQAREIMNNKDNVIRIISGFTGRSAEQVREDIDRDRYMSPIEAVEYGIIDGVIDKDNIIPLQPVPERVKSRLDIEKIYKDSSILTIPEVPDDEIY